VRQNPYATAGLNPSLAELQARVMMAVRVLGPELEARGHMEVLVRTILRDGVRTYAP
jgi:hypothetical protein